MTCPNANGKLVAKLEFNPYLFGPDAPSLWRVKKSQPVLGSPSPILCTSEMGLTQLHPISPGGNHRSNEGNQTHMNSKT